MFNRDIQTKLPRFTAASRGRHHREARKNDKAAKQMMKARYDTKHRTRLVEIKEGDWAYIRRPATTSTKGTWDPTPYQIVLIEENRITGRQHGDEKTGDRSDWKLVAARPVHLQKFLTYTRTISEPPRVNQNPTGWDTDDNDDWPEDDYGRKPYTRAEKARRTAQNNAAPGNPPQNNEAPVNHLQQDRQPPLLPAIPEEEEGDDDTNNEEPLGFGLYDQLQPINQLRRRPTVPPQPQPRKQEEAQERGQADMQWQGRTTPANFRDPASQEEEEERSGQANIPRKGRTTPVKSRDPATPYEDQANPQLYMRDRHKCPACGILLKLYNGRRTCPCDRSGAPNINIDRAQHSMDIVDQHTGDVLGEVATTRGLTNHPLADSRREVQAIITACRETGILMSPSDASSSDAGKSNDGDDERSCYGFSTPSPEVEHYSDIEQDLEYAVILHTIRKRQELHEPQRLSSTREDFLDEDEEAPLLDQDEDVPEGAAAAPQQGIQEDVLHHAPSTSPDQFATPGTSPLHFDLRSGRIKQGASKKRGTGIRGRR